VYWDYLTGWDAWSLTYVVPILCAASLIGLLITVRAVRMQVGDYIVYLGLTVLLGLTPLVFLALGWLGTVIPSAICGGLSVVAIVLLLTVRGGVVRHELATRLHL
jgi:CHASE2 domain-containing sensor protein